ncbi:CsxC family protein [Thalassobacillus devorans]|uniref:CsxC family protein n=1 Tax=Thalassobacillus devorans TaxID=279813 RepID=UPI00048D7FF9|nr:SPOCS domain-containing protein [Thalassobacillus devorans]
MSVFEHDHDHCDKPEKHCHHKPDICIGKIVTKVPVVLAELTIQVDMNASITFPEPVLEIKDVKKRVKITQCRLLLPTNKLFIKGFVRKNIQYASPCTEIEENTATSIASDLHSYTVDIPFETVTEIKKYCSKPVMPKVNHREEFDFFVSKPLPSGYPEKDEVLTSDLSQYHQESMQYYNQLPYCELIASKIIEWDEAVNRMPLPNASPVEEGYFTELEEKMVVDLRVKVLQEQQLRVRSTTNDD